MEWIPLNLPKPEDGKRYDIRLNNGEIIRGVQFWDFGGGFEPLELDQSAPAPNSPVAYPVSEVAAYRLISD